MFPTIDLKISEPAHQFLARIKTLIDEIGGFETKINLEESPSDIYSSTVGFSPNEETKHEGLVGIFVNWDFEFPLIRLQIIAHRWNPDPPTYPVIKEAAENLFRPILKNYNRKHKTRYRMRIDTPTQTLPKLTKAAQRAFDQFAGGANLRALHPLDWSRFYHFVRVCFATGNDPYESDVAYFLRKAGFAPEQAVHIAGIYIHCRDFYIQSDWRREKRHRERNAPRGLRPIDSKT